MLPLRDDEPVHPIVASYRERAFYAFALAGCLALLPFAVHAFAREQYARAAATGVVVALYLVNAAAVALRRSPPVPLIVLAVPTIVVIAVSLQAQGMAGLIWAFPTLLMFQFMFVPRTAYIVNAALVVIVVALGDAAVGGPLILRVAVALVLTLMFSNIFAAFVNAMRNEFESQAVRDPLTGAYNRRQLDAVLDEALERRKRHGVAASLLALDLDHFKAVNDRFGHDVGDLVLRTVVTTIQSRIRRLDLLFRTGGEEFLVLLPHTPLSQAAVVAESLRAAIAAAASRSDHRVTVSIGVAEVDVAEDREQWMRRGDRALYQAKESGRDRVSLAANDHPRSIGSEGSAAHSDSDAS